VQKAQEGELSGSTLTLKVKVGDWVRVKVHKRKWLEPRWTGPYEVKEVTSHSVQVQKAQEGELSGSTLTLKVKVGDWVRVKVHKRKWLEPRWTGPYEVKEVTSHSVQVR
ncbi:unnamed protein product, partial [Coregonus sp. 'balchen']